MSWKWAIWGLLPINSCALDLQTCQLRPVPTCFGEEKSILLIHCQDAYRAHMCTQQRFERLFTTSFFLTWKHLALIFLVYICWVTKGLPKIMAFMRAATAASFRSRAWSTAELADGLSHILQDGQLPDDPNELKESAFLWCAKMKLEQHVGDRFPDSMSYPISPSKFRTNI